MRLNDSDSCHYVWFLFLFRYIKLAFSVGWMKNRKETHQRKCHAHSATPSTSLCSLIWVILVRNKVFIHKHTGKGIKEFAVALFSIWLQWKLNLMCQAVVQYQDTTPTCLLSFCWKSYCHWIIWIFLSLYCNFLYFELSGLLSRPKWQTWQILYKT